MTTNVLSLRLDGSPIGRLLKLLARARNSVSCSTGAAVLLVRSPCVSLAVSVSWARGVYLKRNKASAACDVGTSLDAPALDGDDGAEEIYLTEERFLAGNPPLTTSL